jgi:hypothetical protein
MHIFQRENCVQSLYITHKTSGHTSQRTKSVSITKTKVTIMSMEISSVDCT